MAPARVVEENIDTIIRVEEATLRPQSWMERWIDRVAGFIGTITFVVVQVVACFGWIVVNFGLTSIPRFDPSPFALLSAITSLESVLLMTFVLLRQNRMAAIADRRAHLDLQVNLLAEREVTHLIQAVHGICEHLGLQAGPTKDFDPDFAEHITVDRLVGAIDSRLSE